MFGIRVEARSLNEISSYSQCCLAWIVRLRQPFSLDWTPQHLRTPHAKTFKKPTKHLQASNKTWGQIFKEFGCMFQSITILVQLSKVTTLFRPIPSWESWVRASLMIFSNTGSMSRCLLCGAGKTPHTCRESCTTSPIFLLLGSLLHRGQSMTNTRQAETQMWSKIHV